MPKLRIAALSLLLAAASCANVQSGGREVAGYVWVLGRGYKKSGDEISDAIRRLMNSRNVVMNRQAVEAGPGLLDRGGDFADGAIAYEGEWLGAEEFVSFDSRAVSRLQSLGMKAGLL